MVSCARVTGKNTHSARFIYTPLDAQISADAQLPAGSFDDDLLYLLANTHLDTFYPNGEFCGRISLSPQIDETTAANVIDMVIDNETIHILTAHEQSGDGTRSVEWKKYTKNGTLYDSTTLQPAADTRVFLYTYSNETAMLEYNAGVAVVHLFSGTIADECTWTNVAKMLAGAYESLVQMKCDTYWRIFSNACAVSNGMYILTMKGIVRVSNEGKVVSVTPLNVSDIPAPGNASRIVYSDGRILRTDDSYTIWNTTREEAGSELYQWRTLIDEDVSVEKIHDIARDAEENLWLLAETEQGCRLIVTDGTHTTFRNVVPPDTAAPYAFIHGTKGPVGIVEHEKVYIFTEERDALTEEWQHALFSHADAHTIRISAAMSDKGYLYICASKNEENKWAEGSNVQVYDAYGSSYATYPVNAVDLCLAEGDVTALVSGKGRTDNEGYTVLKLAYPDADEILLKIPSKQWLPVAHTSGESKEFLFLCNDGFIRSLALRERDFICDNNIQLKIKSGATPVICVCDKEKKQIHVYGEEWHDPFYSLNYALRQVYKQGKKIHTKPQHAYNRIWKKQMRKWPRLTIKTKAESDAYKEYSLHVHGGARKIKMKSHSFNSVVARSAGMPAPLKNILLAETTKATISAARINRIKVDGMFTGSIQSHIEKIKRIEVKQSLYNADIKARTDVGIVSSGGEIYNSQIYAGYREENRVGMKGNIRKIASSTGMYNNEFVACAQSDENGYWWGNDTLYRGTIRSVRAGTMRDDEYNGGGGALPGTILQSLIVTKMPMRIIMGKLEECTYIINGKVQ